MSSCRRIGGWSSPVDLLVSVLPQRLDAVRTASAPLGCMELVALL
jgi:hypothetical protein